MSLSQVDSSAPMPRRGRPVLAWSLIILLVGVLVVVQFRRSAASETEDRAHRLAMQIQAQYLVGVADLLKPPRADLLRQAETLNTGPVDDRWRYLALVGELGGPAEALQRLEQLLAKLAEHHIELTAAQASMRDVLERLYRDYERGKLTAPSLREDERLRLRTELGWFGRLALAPAGGPDPEERQALLGQAHRTMAAFLAGFTLLALLGLGGLVGWMVVLILLRRGQLRGGLTCGTDHGAVYAETFALWLLVTTLLNLGASHVPVPGSRLLLVGILDLLSLLVLAWPVFRGVPWRQVREEIGWTRGNRPRWEPAFGVACYAMTLPLLALGLMLTMALLKLQRYLEGAAEPTDVFVPSPQPSHPIVEYLAQSDWNDRLLIWLLAGVVAPLVEETLFRGVLYRHLREASCRWRPSASVLGSALLVAFVFAIIHPQGWAATPALMSLALGFNLMREWRVTLGPSMIAHAINNSLLVLFFILVLGG